MVDISFGVVVSGVTETESEDLLNRLVTEEIVEIGDQSWEIDELGYDQITFHVDYLESDAGDGWYYVFHSALEEPDEGGRLIISFNWYNENVKTRDRVSCRNQFDTFIEIQRSLLNLRDEIQAVSDRNVTVGTIELR